MIGASTGQVFSYAVRCKKNVNNVTKKMGKTMIVEGIGVGPQSQWNQTWQWKCYTK